MSKHGSSREKSASHNMTNPFLSTGDISKPHLVFSLDNLYQIPDLNSKASMLPPVNFHTQANFSSARNNQTQPRNLYEAQIEQLILWKNNLSLLDSHVLEYKIQVDIAQEGKMNINDSTNINDLNSSLSEEIRRLKESLFEISTKTSFKEKALDSINSATQYLIKTYSEEGQDNEFQRMALKLQTLDIEAMSLSNEISLKEKTLFQLEEEIAAEADANRMRFEKLEKLKLELSEKDRDSIWNAIDSLSIGKSKLGSISELIRQKKRHIITLHHLITGLALSSSVEWHLDPELQEAMLDPVFPKDS